MVEVTPASGPGIQYQYDDLGRRISKQIGSGAIEFLSL
ncbi:MAG: hypothetical protein Q7Q71_06455 [Verrucomicrobiota bacterium JB023]|nr:hypothetical protein [Verrucomicrobiota bacterium JB023]